MPAGTGAADVVVAGQLARDLVLVVDDVSAVVRREGAATGLIVDRAGRWRYLEDLPSRAGHPRPVP